VNTSIKNSFVMTSSVGFLILALLLGGCSKKTAGQDLMSAPKEDVSNIDDADFLLASISPANAHPGDIVTLQGDDLNSETDLVFFGGKMVVPGNGFLASDHETGTLQVQVPSGCNEVQVFVVKDPNGAKLKSNSLPFQYMDSQNCASSANSSPNKNDNPGTEETGNTVYGENGNSGIQTASQGFQAITSTDKNIVYNYPDMKAATMQGLLKPGDNAITLTYEVYQGSYTHVDILTKDESGVFLTKKTLPATTDHKGKSSLPIHEDTAIKTRFYSDDKLVYETDPHQIKVIQYGQGNDESITESVQAFVEQPVVTASSSNNFNPKIRIHWVTNNVQSLTLRLSKSQTYQVPNDAILKGYYEYKPGITINDKECGCRKVTIHYEASLNNNDTISGELSAQVVTDKSELANLRIGLDDEPTSHMAKMSFNLKNMKVATITSPTKLYGSDHYLMKPDIEWDGPQQYVYFIKLTPGVYHEEWTYYTLSNCKFKNSDYCDYRIQGAGYDGQYYDETVSLQEFVPSVEKFQVTLKNGDWRQAELEYKIHKAYKVELKYCSNDDINPEVIEQSPIDVTKDFASQVKTIQDIKSFAICPAPFTGVYLRYWDYFGHAYTDFAVANNGTLGAKANLTVKPHYTQKNMAGAMNNTITGYNITWETDWALSAKIVGYDAVKRDPEGNPELCYSEDLSLSYQITQSGTGPQAKFHAVNKGNFMIDSAQPHCHHFRLIAQSYWGPTETPKISVPGQVQIKYDPKKTHYLGTTQHSGEKWHWSKAHMDYMFWCDPEAIEKKYYIEAQNVTSVSFEGGTQDGIHYVCPSEDVTVEDATNGKEDELFARNVTFHYVHSHFKNEPAGTVYGCRLVVEGYDEQTYKSSLQPFPNKHPSEVYPNDCSGIFGFESKSDSPTHHGDFEWGVLFPVVDIIHMGWAKTIEAIWEAAK
jgi:hypothetical protein